jgi:hypothetical protein
METGMNRIGVVASCGVLASALFVGCGPKTETSVEPQIDPNPQSPVEVEPAARSRQLYEQLGALDAARREVPSSTADGRPQLAAALGELERVIATLAGPEPVGAIRQNLRIIETNRQRLGGGSSDLAAEPTINAAFRAAYRALDRIATEQYPTDGGVRQALDQFRGSVDELDTLRGPLHRRVATRALATAGAVAEQMAGVMEQRMGTPARAEPPVPADTAEPAQQPADPAGQPGSQPPASEAPAEPG